MDAERVERTPSSRENGRGNRTYCFKEEVTEKSNEQTSAPMQPLDDGPVEVTPAPNKSLATPHPCSLATYQHGDLPPTSNIRPLYPSGNTSQNLLPRKGVPPPQLNAPPPRAPFTARLAPSLKRSAPQLYTPESLPFLKDPEILEIITELELKAKKRTVTQNERKVIIPKQRSKHTLQVNTHCWKLDEVINFFRGVYLHGWGQWRRVCNIIGTRSNQQTKTHAQKLDQRHKRLRTYFSTDRIQELHREHEHVIPPNFLTKYPNLTKATPPVASKASNRKADETTLIPEDRVIEAAIVMKSLKQDSSKSPSKLLAMQAIPGPVPAINHFSHATAPAHRSFVLANNSLHHAPVSSSRNRPVGTHVDSVAAEDSLVTNKPECVTPVSVNKQIFIPGNRVYARWFDIKDPVSYGTWYPGFVNASKMAPDQDGKHLSKPRLLYHIKFDDGEESHDLEPEHIRTKEQYESWLDNAEKKYALDAPRELFSKRIEKGTQVMARWIDRTDPDMHGKWISGTVESCEAYKKTNHSPFTYHILFENGDEDRELRSEFVLDKMTYDNLRETETNKGKKLPMNGLDLISVQASNISSDDHPPAQPSNGGPSQGGTGEIASEVSDSVAADLTEKDLLCNEVLDSETASTVCHASIVDAPSPEHNYGSYMVVKPKRRRISPICRISSDQPASQVSEKSPSPWHGNLLPSSETLTQSQTTKTESSLNNSSSVNKKERSPDKSCVRGDSSICADRASTANNNDAYYLDISNIVIAKYYQERSLDNEQKCPDNEVSTNETLRNHPRISTCAEPIPPKQEDEKADDVAIREAPSKSSENAAYVPLQDSLIEQGKTSKVSLKPSTSQNDQHLQTIFSPFNGEVSPDSATSVSRKANGNESDSQSRESFNRDQHRIAPKAERCGALDLKSQASPGDTFNNELPLGVPLHSEQSSQDKPLNTTNVSDRRKSLLTDPFVSGQAGKAEKLVVNHTDAQHAVKDSPVSDRCKIESIVPAKALEHSKFFGDNEESSSGQSPKLKDSNEALTGSNINASPECRGSRSSVPRNNDSIKTSVLRPGCLAGAVDPEVSNMDTAGIDSGRQPLERMKPGSSAATSPKGDFQLAALFKSVYDGYFSSRGAFQPVKGLAGSSSGVTDTKQENVRKGSKNLTNSGGNLRVCADESNSQYLRSPSTSNSTIRAEGMPLSPTRRQSPANELANASLSTLHINEQQVIPAPVKKVAVFNSVPKKTPNTHNSPQGEFPSNESQPCSLDDRKHESKRQRLSFEACHFNPISSAPDSHRSPPNPKINSGRKNDIDVVENNLGDEDLPPLVNMCPKQSVAQHSRKLCSKEALDLNDLINKAINDYDKMSSDRRNKDKVGFSFRAGDEIDVSRLMDCSPLTDDDDSGDTVSNRNDHHKIVASLNGKYPHQPCVQVKKTEKEGDMRGESEANGIYAAESRNEGLNACDADQKINQCFTARNGNTEEPTSGVSCVKVVVKRTGHSSLAQEGTNYSVEMSAFLGAYQLYMDAREKCRQRGAAS